MNIKVAGGSNGQYTPFPIWTCQIPTVELFDSLCKEYVNLTPEILAFSYATASASPFARG